MNMDVRSLVVHLESPVSNYVSTEAGARDVVLAGLNWPTEYWAALAVGWLEQGVPVDAEILSVLNLLVENKHYSQAIRHRAFAIVRRYEKGGSVNA
ncbi:hypothetical protein QZJ86_01110 [Methylomonas montana]|uniref:hypothetical protein n=1 Tax=Methylomonas montana TaxID=3058963 RepID=UPI00265861BD|nr:hypothetical protein [Methylomonas montana]WKJ90765.1 hypothetical protein QZJ86_01110 [Methylomonas montana]